MAQVSLQTHPAWKLKMRITAGVNRPLASLCERICLQLARHRELDSKVRVKALSFISSVTRLKKKVTHEYSYVYNTHAS